MLNLPPEIVAAQLDEYRLQFEAGERDALMRALLFCAKEHVIMPPWVDWELHQAWHRFIRRSVDDLGEAFGITWPKGKHKAAYLKRRRLQHAVHRRVRDLHFKQQWKNVDGEWVQATNPDWPLDERLFAKVGKDLGVGKKLAAEYYYAVSKSLASGPSIGVRMLLEPYIIKSTD
jgi:hypothetical protein